MYHLAPVSKLQEMFTLKLILQYILHQVLRIVNSEAVMFWDNWQVAAKENVLEHYSFMVKKYLVNYR